MYVLVVTLSPNSPKIFIAVKPTWKASHFNMVMLKVDCRNCTDSRNLKKNTSTCFKDLKVWNLAPNGYIASKSCTSLRCMQLASVQAREIALAHYENCY